jgi:glycosyltransferase involved in cell wall biosynthesis
MRRLVLHFGMHKTGSSSIQNSLAKANLGPGWEYAKLGNPNHSELIQSAFIQDPFRLRGHQLQNISKQQSLQLKAEHRALFESSLKDCSKDNLIISGEELCNLTQDELSDLNAICLALGFQTEAVGYVREPKSRIESAFQQRLKSMHPTDIGELDDVFPQYRQALGKFGNVLGDSNVSYWRYGTDTLVDQCVVKDFLFRLGIRPKQITVQNDNESISLRSVRFLYTYRKLGPGVEPGSHVLKHNEMLVHQLTALNGPKLSFSKTLIDPIIESNQDDIQWVNSKLDSPLPTPTDTNGLPGCVKNESDFFEFDDESIHWLADAINKSSTDYSGDPNQIAMWVHILQQQLCANETREKPRSRPSSPQVVGEMMKSPGVFERLRTKYWISPWSENGVVIKKNREKEIEDQLNLVYREVLEREGDPEGLATYGKLLKKGISIEEIESMLKDSEEFASVQKKKAEIDQRQQPILDKEARIVTDLYLRSRIDLAPMELKPDREEFDPQKLNIHWVIPDFSAGAGGHMTIFRIVRLLELLGHSNTIWIHDAGRVHDDENHAYNDIVKHFQLITADVKFADKDLSTAAGDIVFATDWVSVNYVNTMSFFKRRFYLVQDYEPQFFGAGSQSISAERTYSDDLDCICASPWLRRLLEQRHGRWAREFRLAVDTSIYSTTNIPHGLDAPRKIRIAFYARYESPRRAVELGFLALEDLARRGVDFEVHYFGTLPYFSAAPFNCIGHGILSPEQLAELYRSCDIGMVFSATNYSLVPQEMMACGLPVAELDGESTRAIYPSGVVALLSPDPRQMSVDLEALINDKERRQIQASRALEWVNQFEWEDAARVVEISIQERLTEKGFKKTNNRLDVLEKKASVIIPTLNGGEMFENVIHALREQQAPWEYEILVIDSGSTDGTVEFVKKFPDIKLHQIDKSEFQHGRTRNLAISLTSGEFIAVLTQDALPKNDQWLYNLVAILEHYPNAAGAFGRHEARPNADPFTKRDLVDHFSHFENQPHNVSKDTDLEKWRDKDIGWQQFLRFYSNNNSCLRRSVWEKIPYPEVDFGEDQVWAWEIIKSGYQKLYVSQAVVYHSHNYSEQETEERAFTEAIFFRKQFGYQLLGNVDAEQVVDDLNAVDSDYANTYELDKTLLTYREGLNNARIKGRLRAKETPL